MAGEFSANMVFCYLGLGLVAGIVSATFGVGSGIIVVPALAIVAGLTQKEAQGIALVVMVPMALIGALRYHFNADIHLDYRIALIMAVTVVVGVNIGANIVGAVSNRQLQFGFACFLIIVAIRMVLTALKTTN